MFGKNNPLPVTTDVGHRVSGHFRVRPALLRSMQCVGANANGRVFINDHRLVGQGLRFGRINITAYYPLDETFFVIGFSGTEGCDEFVIKNPPKSSRVVQAMPPRNR